MNELIWKLAEQAGFDTTDRDKRYLIKSFTELVVNECANVADSPDVDMLRVGDAIHEHFGML